MNYDWLLAQLDFWNPKCELVLTALDGLTRVMHPSFNDSRCTYYSSTMPGTPTTSQHCIGPDFLSLVACYIIITF